MTLSKMRLFWKENSIIKNSYGIRWGVFISGYGEIDNVQKMNNHLSTCRSSSIHLLCIDLISTDLTAIMHNISCYLCPNEKFYQSSKGFLGLSKPNVVTFLPKISEGLRVTKFVHRHSMQLITLYSCYKNNLFQFKSRAAMKVLSSRKHYYIKRLFFPNAADKIPIYYENILPVKCYQSQFCRVSNGMSSRNFCITWTSPSKGSWFFESLPHKTDSTVLLLR